MKRPSFSPALLASLLALAALLWLGGCATEPNLYTGQTGYFGYTWNQELQLGKTNDQGIVQQMGLYPDDELARYINDLGQEILSHSELKSPDSPEIYRDTPFTFRLLDSPVVNAFALPGGYVYVTRGLLAHCQNEAQLALIVGHEITHVEARHASKQALKQQWGQIGLLAGAIIGETVADDPEMANRLLDLSGELFQLVTLKYGRDAERESDLHGVKYAARAGYETSEGSHFFTTLKRISQKSGQSIPTWMSSHPDPGEREQTIKRLADELTPDGSPRRIEEQAYLKRIEGLVVGENPRHGYTKGNTFYHPDLRLTFEAPIGWKIRNETQAVHLSDPQGYALAVFTQAKEPSVQAALQAFGAKQGIQVNRIHEALGSSQSIEGTIATASGNLPFLASFVEHDGSVFTFLGYSSAGAYASMRPQFQKCFNSFAELRDREALAIQPTRLKIVAAKQNAPFRSFLPASLPSGTEAEDWAIMNQVQLDEEMPRGKLLKLPQ